MTGFPSYCPTLGKVQRKEGRELGVLAAPSLPGRVSPPAHLDLLTQVRPLPGHQACSKPQRPEGNLHRLCRRGKKEEGLVAMGMEGERGAESQAVLEQGWGRQAVDGALPVLGTLEVS